MDEIKWPPRLLRVLRDHLGNVEHPIEPRTTPLSTKPTQRSVLSFLLDINDAVRERSGASASVTLCCENLVLDMIEQCCGFSFLSSKERRTINLAATQREKRLESRNMGKRRRVEQDSGAVSAGPTRSALSSQPKASVEATDARTTRTRKCAAVLPVEYLLRFFVALPSLLAHYDKLSGCAMPASYKQPLWDYVNAVLDIMKDIDFIDQSDHVPLR
ncbi:hypothetical protein ERJ75_001022600 [Trypanosoma vivax]|uniref:MRG domain-containing protein n=1 Tax=Trypanosoma vivax (strain Y486) TaxID=1055687 RepID=G0TR00_TRYVY|nr:hypothetical protein ERJ75_001022600 [Trypanosoma vivax]CCC46363.1 conserved hypothetical protein, fragment [Trypanosoma vivax Y486]